MALQRWHHRIVGFLLVLVHVYVLWQVWRDVCVCASVLFPWSFLSLYMHANLAEELVRREDNPIRIRMQANPLG